MKSANVPSDPCAILVRRGGAILPVMRLFLYGETAAQWWAHARGFDRASEAARFDASVLRECAPSVKTIRYLVETFPFLSPPYHVLASSDADKRALGSVVVHVSGFPYGGGSFIRVAGGVYVPSPELCFAQFAGNSTLIRSIKEGFALCGSFALDESSETGLSARRPVASTRSLGRFLDSHSSLHGTAKARRAIRWVMDGSASPRESDLAMRLTLPQRLGGFGIPGARLNRRIDPQKLASRLTDSEYFVGDLCWEREKLVVEYDSDLHLTSSGLAHDAEKRGVLEEDGYKVITVTKLQLDSPVEMARIAWRIGRHLGIRVRIQNPDFNRLQTELFRLG